MKPNPPVPGHALLHEGVVFPLYRQNDGRVIHRGGCECGAKPDGFPDVSTNAMRRWHRQHKEDIRRWVAS